MCWFIDFATFETRVLELGLKMNWSAGWVCLPCQYIHRALSLAQNVGIDEPCPWHKMWKLNMHASIMLLSTEDSIIFLCIWKSRLQFDTELKSIIYAVVFCCFNQYCYHYCCIKSIFRLSLSVYILILLSFSLSVHIYLILLSHWRLQLSSKNSSHIEMKNSSPHFGYGWVCCFNLPSYIINFPKESIFSSLLCSYMNLSAPSYVEYEFNKHQLYKQFPSRLIQKL